MKITEKARAFLNRVPVLKKPIRRAYYMLRFEPPIQPYDLTPQKIRDIVGKENPTILEIGCHDGENTAWFVDEFAAAEVHCFEPDPRAIAKFERRLGQNPLVHLHPFAIGAESGKMKFYQSSGKDKREWDASGSLMQPKNHLKEFPWVTFDDEIEVEVRTLESVCNESEIDEVDLIWMDVQGAEELVISGGKKIFEKAKVIITEYNNKELYEGQPTMKRILELLPSHRVAARYPDDLLLKRKSM